MEIVKQTNKFIIVKPNRLTERDGYVDALEIAQRDWKGEFNARSIVWDTFTERARLFLQMSAKVPGKKFGDRGIVFGDANHTYTAPAASDYGAAQSLCMDIRGFFQQQPLHRILVGHIGRETRKSGDSVITTAAGFGLVGQALVSSFGSDFDQYLRIFTEGGGRFAQLEAQPVYGSGVRTVSQLEDKWPLALSVDSQVAFWQMLAEASRIQPDGSNGYFYTAIYGEPKIGKTLTVTTLPDWMYPLVYIAEDPGSQFMRSTFPSLLEAP